MSTTIPTHAFNKNEDEWKKKLTPEQYEVCRLRGTEAPFTGKLYHNTEKGMYQCAACGQDLFSSETKFDSGSGWPSFTEPVHREHVDLREDTTLGMVRTEVVCKRCGSHLGHVFPDGPADRGGQRYCINSVALEFKKK